MKPRINVYLDHHVAEQLDLVTKRPGSNKSRIVSDVLNQFFNPEENDVHQCALQRRLDRLQKHLKRTDRNVSVTIETLALFTRYFLTITPPLPTDEQASAHANGLQRFELFIAQVGRRLAQNSGLVEEMLAGLTEDKPDLFMRDFDQVGQKAELHSITETTSDDGLPPLMPVDLSEYDLDDDPDLLFEEEFND